LLVKGVDLETAKAVLRDVERVDVVTDLKINLGWKTCLFFMDKEMEAKIQRRILFNLKIPVVPVQDNIVFKLIIQRTENQGKHDMEDTKNMLRMKR
jgi:hypothetical protein